MMYFMLLIALAAAAEPTFNCKNPPKFTIQGSSSCCKVQIPNFDNLPNECSKYMTKLGFPVSPCAYECVFNYTHILQNGKFEIANIHPHLQKVYSDKITLDIYLMGLEKCAKMFNKIISEQNSQNKGSTGYSKMTLQPCSSMSLKFILCASREVFENCPASLWTATSTCDELQKFSKNCHRPESLKRKSNRKYSSE